MLTRNSGAEAGGWGERSQAKDGASNSGARDRRGAQSPHHSLLSLTPSPLCPHPKQDAVSMTTWPARKGGWGLQRKFSTSAGREEVECRKEGAGYGEGRPGPWNPKSSCPLPQDSHPPPPSEPAPSLLGHCGGEGKVPERIKGQMSKDRPLPRPGGEGGGEQLPELRPRADHRIQGHGF